MTGQMDLIKSGQPIASFLRPRIVVPNIRGIAVYTTTVTPRPEYVPVMGNPSPFTAVLAVIDLSMVRPVPMLNTTMDRGWFYTTDPGMKKIDLFEFDQIARTQDSSRGELLLAAPGNANIFTNFGYWAYFSGFGHPSYGVFHHFAEHLEGPNPALMILGDDRGTARILSKTFDKKNVEGPIFNTMLGGAKIISAGEVMTPRDAFMGAMGDIQHWFKKMPDPIETVLKKMCLVEAGYGFEARGIENTNYCNFFQGWGTKVFKRETCLPQKIAAMLEGKTVVIPGPIALDPQKMRGYKLVDRPAADFGEIGIVNGDISIRAPRSTFNHFLAATTRGGDRLLLFGVFDQDKPENTIGRKGLLIEDTALLAQTIARECGIEIRHALVLCNGTDSLIYTPDFRIDSYDHYGVDHYEPNSCRRPLTSALLFYPRD